MTHTGGALGAMAIEGYLEQLASRRTAPAAGAVGAMHAAQAAALVGMAAEFTARHAEQGAGHGPGYDGGNQGRRDRAVRIAAEAAELRRTAVAQADADAAAFGRVVECLGMPRDTEEEATRRKRAVGEAAIEATLPPRALLEVASGVLRLAGELLEDCKKNVVSDLAVAAESARAAAATALVAVEANLLDRDAEVLQRSLAEFTERAGRLMDEAGQLSRRVRDSARGAAGNAGQGGGS